MGRSWRAKATAVFAFAGIALGAGALAARLGPAAASAAAAGVLVAGAGTAPASEPGTLVVAKQVTDGSGPDAGIFAFNGSWGDAWQLIAGGRRATELPAGEYSFTEQLEPGYDFLGISCSTPSGDSAFAEPVATVPVVAGRETACTSASKPKIDINVDPEITGNARLRLQRSCSRPHRLVARVVAGNASRVSFRVNYRWVTTVRRPVRGSIFQAVARVGRGAVPVSARVRFVAGASPEQERLTRVAASCLRNPAFAGKRR